MSEIVELRERMMAATGPDRALDAAIWDHFYPAKVTDIQLPVGFGSGPPLGFGRCDPEYTSSIDAALDLVRQRLPYWTTDVHTADATPEDYPIVLEMTAEVGGDADCEISYQHPKMEARLIGEGWGPTLPLAVVRALLDALTPA